MTSQSETAAARPEAMPDNEIVFSVRGRVGFILLNRPKALNALTHAMCVEMNAQLAKWAHDPKVETVAIEGEGEKGFCAGGDVVKVARSGQTGTFEWRDFFRDEYRNNAAIKHFPKPYVALLDGIAMGGGVGVSVHGAYRVATERTMLAMPETGLGLIPDVGGSYILPRLPGATGMYLALTGYRAKAGDCLYLGLATHYVPSERLTDLKAKLAEAPTGGDIAAVGVLLDDFAEDPGPAPLAEHRDAIDRCFARDSVEDILAALTRKPTDWAARQAADLRGKSPTSLKLTFEQMRRGGMMSFDECLKMEFRLVSHIILRGDDFYEGVRALLVEKDKAPSWKPASLDAVPASEIDAYFDDLGGDELTFPSNA